MHRARARHVKPADFVFATSTGNARERNNVRERILKPAIVRANVALAADGREPISPDVTFHSLRHTYASLMIEAGADPAYVMAQIGHTTAGFTMEVYTHVNSRREGANAALDALLRPPADPPIGH